MTVGTYADFFTALGKNESGNNYGFVSSLGYLGRFQFGEEALQAIGFYNGDGSWAIDFAGSWTEKAHSYGVYDKQSFLNSSAAQDAATHAWFSKINDDLTQLGLHQYAGQWIGGVQISTSGLIAGAHLVGVWNLKSFLETGGANDTRDGYGTPVSEYVSRFGSFETPFSAGAPAQGGAGAANGTAGDDVLRGQAAADHFEGGAGADSIFGGEGGDRLVGGEGRNQLRGEGGDDLLLGGGEFDDLHGNQGADTVYGGRGDDWVVGGQGGDLQYGDEGGDLVYGNMGADSLFGGDGEDRLLGGQDSDRLDGGAGADFLSGDRGDDVIFGGGGGDRFFTFDGAGIDRVMDFNYADGDRVSLQPGSAYTAYQGEAGVVIDLHGGDQMILAGVSLSSLPSDWIG
jgi:serralysin